MDPSTPTRADWRARRALRSFGLAALLVALFARPAGAATQIPKSALVGDVTLTADEVHYDEATGRVLLKGNAVVRRGFIVLRASSAEYDPESGEVRATGNVLLTDPTRVISADAVRAIINGPGDAEGVLAFVKDKPVDLSGVRSAEEGRRTGRNRLTVSASSLHTDPDGHMLLKSARLTLCDCPGGGSPTWEITTSEADVVPGERAILHWPVLRVTPIFMDHTVPVFVFPWGYVPLSDRQSGLLIPTLGPTLSGGNTIYQPVFLTLGRSYDATITPWYAQGHGLNPAGSVRGPGADLELRWAPVEGATGRADFTWVNDLAAEPGGASGDRWGLNLTHAQRVGDSLSIQSGLKLAGDSVWIRDMSTDRNVASAPYERSDLLGSYRAGSTATEAVLSYLQPFDPSVVSTIQSYGTLGADRGIASRLGAAATTLAPVAAGPFRISGRLGAARFGPVNGSGATPAISPSAPNDLDRPPVTRVDARTEVDLPLLLGDAVAFVPLVRGAALGYAPDGAPNSGVAWGVGGARLETELSRSFGALRNVIVPRIEWRASTGTLGQPLSIPAYDYLDRSSSTQSLLTASPGAFDQLRASVETRLELAAKTLARIELGQDADLRAGRLAEGFVNLSASAGRVSANANARFFTVGTRAGGTPQTVPPTIPSAFLDRFTELGAGISAEDARGDGVRVGYSAVGAGGSGILMAGLDPLFDERASQLQASASAWGGLRATLGPAKLGYDVSAFGRAENVAPGYCGVSSQQRLPAFHVTQQTGTFVWTSSCKCFRMTLSVSATDCGFVSYGYSVEFFNLGTPASAFAPH